MNVGDPRFSAIVRTFNRPDMLVRALGSIAKQTWPNREAVVINDGGESVAHIVERFRDELGDWRVCILSPFGTRIHAPWATAIESLLSERAGHVVQTLWTDDGVLLLPDQEPVVGRAALWEFLQAQRPAQEDIEITRYVHRFEEITVLGEWAFEWGTFEGAARPRSGGPRARVGWPRGGLRRGAQRLPRQGLARVAASNWKRMSTGTTLSTPFTT